MKILRAAVVLCPVIILFQNCSPGFYALSPEGLNALSSSGQVLERMTCNETLRGIGDTSSRKLTRLELEATLTSVFGTEVSGEARVVSALDNIPGETSKTFGKNFLPTLTPSHLDGLMAIATAVGDVVADDRGKISRVLKNCDPQTNLQACTDELLSGFALKVLRRPIDSETRTEVVNLMNGSSGVDKLRLGIARLLLSPFFYQHIETGSLVSGSRLKLTPYEVASRLSYRLIGAPPDAELMAAAASNALNVRTQLEVHAKRLMATAQARKHVRNFFTTWLGLERTPDPDGGISTLRGIASVGLGAEAREEMLKYVDYMVFTENAGFERLFTSQIVFPYTDRLANLYGVQKSDQPVASKDGRGGMVLRIANLMNNSLGSNPIVRGGHIRTHILCQDIPPPDPNLVADRLSETEILSHLDLSTRSIVHQTTGVKQCIGCHAMINPLGFALEGFDGFGMPRDLEKVYDSSLKVVAEHNVDSYVTDLNIAPVPKASVTAADLVKELGNSDRARVCMGKKIIEYTRERAATSNDGCAVNEGAAFLTANGSIRDYFINTAISDDVFWKAAN